jgi:hypothetical protein
MDGERTAAMEAYPDVQFSSFPRTEGPQVAVSRRSGDEIHPLPPNGGLRP